MRAFAIILAVAATAACGVALAQTTTPNVVNPTPTSNSPYFHYDQLLDVLQFAGGELPNDLRVACAAYSPS
jgi:ABC-type enterochelin transport system permease subunit